jgi:hypothetical protein
VEYEKILQNTVFSKVEEPWAEQAEPEPEAEPGEALVV